jgi:uncharacterized protein (DUF1810 family)
MSDSASPSSSDPFQLSRFLSAQEGVHAVALAELRAGAKRSHWMWFVFPQIDGLGSSSTARFYAIRSLAEARAYLGHAVLGARLVECCRALLDLEGAASASRILGHPDDLKLRSSMTLFEAVAPDAGSLFAAVLDKYFDGERDPLTLSLLRVESK